MLPPALPYSASVQPPSTINQTPLVPCNPVTPPTCGPPTPAHPPPLVPKFTPPPSRIPPPGPTAISAFRRLVTALGCYIERLTEALG
eukprot:775585-Prorocentrum_minimum.AAC.1